MATEAELEDFCPHLSQSRSGGSELRSPSAAVSATTPDTRSFAYVRWDTEKQPLASREYGPMSTSRSDGTYGMTPEQRAE